MPVRRANGGSMLEGGPRPKLGNEELMQTFISFSAFFGQLAMVNEKTAITEYANFINENVVNPNKVMFVLNVGLSAISNSYIDRGNSSCIIIRPSLCQRFIISHLEINTKFGFNLRRFHINREHQLRCKIH